MTRIVPLGSKTVVVSPPWTGEGFGEPTAQRFWEVFPETLRRVARAEYCAGNAVTQVLRNDELGIMLLEFGTGPLVGSDFPGLTVYTQHRYGNHCYDGTKCTVEDPATGCFVAFLDPEWVETE